MPYVGSRIAPVSIADVSNNYVSSTFASNTYLQAQGYGTGDVSNNYIQAQGYGTGDVSNNYIQDQGYGTGDVSNTYLQNAGFVSVQNGAINFPQSNTDPSNPQTGDVYFNTDTSELKIYDGTSFLGSWVSPKGTSIDNPFTTWNEINAANSLVTGNGLYWVKFSGMSSAVEMYISSSRSGDGGKNVIRIVQGNYATTPTTNLWNTAYPIPFKRLIVQRTDESLTGWAVASSDITLGTGTGTSGVSVSSAYTSNVKIIMNSFSGGFGIYNATTQNQCSWADAVGAIGAGWNGSTCDTYIWGTGTSGTPVYNNRSGNWSLWIGED